MIEATAVDNLAEARLIVAELTPGHLQSRTLVEALARLADDDDARDRHTGVVSVAGEPAPLGGNAEVVVLRGAQEALSNVRRHSGAAVRRRWPSSYDPTRVALEVTDDGLRLRPRRPRGRGFGLDGLRARAAESAETSPSTVGEPGGGTRLVLELPR